jgi:protein-arginine kinase activator protein McsA
MSNCDRCQERPATYEITLRDGMDMKTEHLCLQCYKKAQTESIVDVKIIK